MVRVFTQGGQKIVIKKTDGSYFAGAEPNEIRNFMRAYHSAIRSGSVVSHLSLMRTPQVYARTKKFLLLEYIKCDKSIPRDRVRAARKELSESMIRVSLESGLRAPQVSDFIPAGIINGKVIFYVVYDYF